MCRYFVDWDPTSLSIPCHPDSGNWLPIHWSTAADDIQQFSSVLQAGMRYFPEKIGSVISERNQTFELDEDDDEADNEADNEVDIEIGTPYQFACKKYAYDAVTKVVIDRIAECCEDIAASTTTSNAESTLLMSAITDEIIHLDCLYILLRRDPYAGLLRLQQLLEGQSSADAVNNASATSSISASASAACSSSNSTTASTNRNNNNNGTQSSSEGEKKKRKHDVVDDGGDSNSNNYGKRQNNNIQ